MEPVSNVSQLVEILRKQLIDSQNKTGAAARTPQGRKTVIASSRPSVEELQQKIREKLRRIDPNDPKSGHKSVHVFLESVLVWEFGERLMNDPKFYALLDDVQHSMASDPAVREELTSLITQLR